MARTSTACRRTQRRHRLRPDADVCVEFVYPQPHGAPCRCPVVDFSVAGFSFVMPDELDGVEVGDSLGHAAIRFGKVTLNGDLMVMHVTEERGICGVLFYPASDSDLLQLKSMIAGIEAVSAG